MKTITVDEVMSWSPCKQYTRERVAELPDRIWWIWACDCAERAVKRYWRPKTIGLDRRHWRAPQEAIAARRRWLDGEATDHEMDAASAAAWAAAAWDTERRWQMRRLAEIIREAVEKGE